jgi:transcriptional regulator with XRE-family HTH domain
MNRAELQELKMAWIAAREAADMPAQVALLREHPEALADLTDFIAAYSATSVAPGVEHSAVLPLTMRARQTAIEHVFAHQTAAPANLQQLRSQRGLTLVSAARGLRLGVDVWKKFEAGAIDAASLSERQLERLARYFQVTLEQFGTLLINSQPAFVLDRRQSAQAARSKQQGPARQSFAEALAKSAMGAEEKRLWMDQAETGAD